MTHEERKAQLAYWYRALHFEPMKCARIVRRVAAAKGLRINRTDEQLAPVAAEVWRERAWQAIARLQLD